MVAVKFYLLIGILIWAIFYAVVVQNMKKPRRPEKPQMQSAIEEDNKELTHKAYTNGYVKLLAEK